MERFATIVTIVGGIFGIISIIYIRHKDKKEKRKEKEEGKAFLPTCDVHLFSRLKLTEKEYQFAIGLPSEVSNKDHYILSLPLSIGNTGGSDLEDVKIVFRYQKESPLAISNEVIKFQPITNLVKASRNFEKTDEGQFATFHLNKIPIKVSARLNEPISLFPSPQKMTIPLKSKTDIKLVGNLKFEIKYFFEFYVSAKNTEIKKIKINIYAYPSKNIEELVNIVAAKIENNINKRPDDKFPETVMLFYPDFTFHSKQEGYSFYTATVNYEKFRSVYVKDYKIIIQKYVESDNQITEIPI
ncbi:hypothetical protein LK994_13330 [Ferruginibacter lapsinanis]|uniref:hypothetical protein n=1 Tax=Ferruginibacter lapsinanis TaxID=563172 RepID=UPI001E4477C4|nr:hypothetical protein [Ferruginibacter lapsinanis]UEG49618.1 hypothetical protein LK994_13330 [Ferruginibacter lapsinanis]